jgi:hypothetical protein
VVEGRQSHVVFIFKIAIDASFGQSGGLGEIIHGRTGISLALNMGAVFSIINCLVRSAFDIIKI